MNNKQLRALVMLCVFGCAIGAKPSIAAADAPTYSPVVAQSSVSFVGTQQGEKFTGVFGDYDARIAYAPDQLATSHIDVTIRLKSLDSKSQERDSALAGADWFDFQKFPTAVFHASAIHATPTGPVGDADLTIKGRTKHLVFPFAWTAQAGKATLDARVTLDRLDFGLGAGEWADEGIAGKKVEVVVHLVLVAATGAAAAPPASPAAKLTAPATTSPKH